MSALSGTQLLLTCPFRHPVQPSVRDVVCPMNETVVENVALALVARMRMQQWHGRFRWMDAMTLAASSRQWHSFNVDLAHVSSKHMYILAVAGPELFYLASCTRMRALMYMSMRVPRNTWVAPELGKFTA